MGQWTHTLKLKQTVCLIAVRKIHSLYQSVFMFKLNPGFCKNFSRSPCVRRWLDVNAFEDGRLMLSKWPGRSFFATCLAAAQPRGQAVYVAWLKTKKLSDMWRLKVLDSFISA